MFDLTSVLTNTCDIVRPVRTQDAIGGTVYDYVSNPTALATALPCSIQTMKPADIEDFSRRSIKVDTKVYIQTDVGAKLGDVVVDARYSPVRSYVVQFTEDMAGYGQMYGLFCSLKK